MRVAVLGAGLLGSCLALELALRGCRADLIEKNATALAEASANNEGKIHLGYVYAKDESLATARLMIGGALSFEHLMRRWIGGAIDAVPRTSPFYYAVHRDSLVSPEQVKAHLKA